MKKSEATPKKDGTPAKPLMRRAQGELSLADLSTVVGGNGFARRLKTRFVILPV